MSEIEMNEAERLNQLLCAYVLGEANEVERAEIEAALAKDGALREERARIEATIGLVKSSMSKDETLSYRAASEVARAAAQLAQPMANGRRGGAWYQSSSLRIAASIVAIVGGGFLGWKAFVKHDSAGALRGGLMLATVEEESAAKDERGVRESKAAGRDFRGKSLGYADSAVLAPKPAEPEAKAAITAPSTNSASEALNARIVHDGVEEALEKRDRGLGDDRLALLDEVPRADSSVPPGEPAPEAEELYLPMAKVAASDVPEPSGRRGLRSGAHRELKAAAPSAGVVDPATTQLSTLGYGGPTTPGAVAPGSNATGSAGPATAGRPAGPGAPGSKASLAAGGGEGLKKLAEVKLGAAKGTDNDNFFYKDGQDGDIKGRTEGFFDDLEDSSLDDTAGVPTAGTEFERVDRLTEGKGKSRDDDAPREQARVRQILTPEQREARIELVLASCRRIPNEKPRDMFFRFWGDNPFEWTANDRQSTFSMDVDTASYTLARKYLVDGHLPEKAQIRTEEFVNYFKPDIAPPTKGTFAIVTELAPSRYSNPIENKWMLRVAVRGVEVPRAERAPLALTFVIDVSGSMQTGGRLELVKHALRQLLTQLDARDSIAIVAFSDDSRLILPMTSAAKSGLIESAIQPLHPEQSTNTEAGLRMGYEQALSALTSNATNRVVLLTDGVANVGLTDPNALVQTVERQRKAGIYLNTIGVGMDNHNDNLLEQLADKGDGLCNYVDDEAEVKHALVDNFLQALVPIARDAKVQVEFDPAQVESYRLLGYENRAIADQDFRNDKVDAGEINSGHQITALYEIVRTGPQLPGAAQDAPLAKVNVRFKPPHKNGIASPATEEASEISQSVLAKQAAVSFETTPFGYRRAVLAAQFAEFLRRSVHARGDSLDLLIADVKKLSSENNKDAELAELSDMIVKSKVLLDRELARHGELEAKVYELRNDCWRRAELEAQRRETDREALRILDEQIRESELALHKLLQERIR